MRLAFALACALGICAQAGIAATVTVRGVVLDPSGAPIPGAQIAARNRLGVVAQTSSDHLGAFDIDAGDSDTLIATAPGFSTATVPVRERVEIHLAIAPQVDSVQVPGSAIDVPLSEQGSSVTVIPRQEIQQRNEARASDLLRYVPGAVISQTGSPGGATSLFLRGGNANFNLVRINGVAVNPFGLSIGFDFAHVPADFLERIEVIRGPQSALYGAGANSGVVNFVTRSATKAPSLNVLAEGGTWRERRFALAGGGALRGFGILALASSFNNDGPVPNSDYRNQNLDLNVSRRNLVFNGNFNSNDTGQPGPWGSDPARLFPGIDLVSRNRNNFSDYGVRYQFDATPRVRTEFFGGFFLNNNEFAGPFSSFNKDIRGQAEARTILSVTRGYTMAAGYEFTREEARNTYISDDNFVPFLLRRDQHGIYWENRLALGGRFFANAGVRGEIIDTPAIPGNAAFGRPPFASNTIRRLSPKIALASVWRGTRLHASFGAGIRPPQGLELAFTSNPALKPERTASFDAGVEQRLAASRVSLDATYFYNRYYDLIVSLGGTLAHLSSFTSDNLANSRARGLELTARARPAAWASITGTYTYLGSRILSLDRSRNLAPQFFEVGQPLLRRPAHSGAITSAFSWRRITTNVVAYFRGETLDVEPNYGASAGLFRNPGYANLGINLNIALAHGVTAYGNLRNALNQRYEEVFGYPSAPLNFVAGLKWSLHNDGHDVR